MRSNVSKLWVSRRPHWGRWVMALVVVVIAVAVVAPTTVVPMVGGAVAVGPPTVGDDGATAAVCQSGFACGGAPVAIECQSGHCVRWAVDRDLAAAGYECHVPERRGLRRLSLPACSGPGDDSGE